MGLAPLHTWLPDAHSEAPSPVSALLSGALLNCAFLGILRFFQLALAVGEGALARNVLVGFGLVSLGIAAGSILGSRDYKRLLAYSSVEHMGLLAVGVGIGGAASYGALFHALNHSLAKAMLFLVAGNVLLGRGTKDASLVRGLAYDRPATAALLLAGVFAIGGLPPFALFQSELVIVAEAVRSGRLAVGAVTIAFLAIAFLGTAAVLLPMTRGGVGSSFHLASRRRAEGSPDPSDGDEADEPEPWLLVGPPLVLGAALLVLGVYVPPGLHDVLRAAAGALGAP
jgi:hydrogenase-4 component F